MRSQLIAATEKNMQIMKRFSLSESASFIDPLGSPTTPSTSKKRKPSPNVGDTQHSKAFENENETVSLKRIKILEKLVPVVLHGMDRSPLSLKMKFVCQVTRIKKLSKIDRKMFRKTNNCFSILSHAQFWNEN